MNHVRPSSVTRPLWWKLKSNMFRPTEKPRCHRRISEYGRLSSLSLSLSALADNGKAAAIKVTTSKTVKRCMIGRWFIFLLELIID